ncbi:hypothetical protein DFH09DRAFT_1376051 [Mycena vulgaris]|nr:hypothetical protein DFH09DRAFT_1376051 [Mycena vulgaris]
MAKKSQAAGYEIAAAANRVPEYAKACTSQARKSHPVGVEELFDEEEDGKNKPRNSSEIKHPLRNIVMEGGPRDLLPPPSFRWGQRPEASPLLQAAGGACELPPPQRCGPLDPGVVQCHVHIHPHSIAFPPRTSHPVPLSCVLARHSSLIPRPLTIHAHVPFSYPQPVPPRARSVPFPASRPLFIHPTLCALSHRHDPSTHPCPSCPVLLPPPRR